MNVLVPISQLVKKRNADDPKIIGGKAARLVWLERHNFPCPRAWVLPASYFADVLKGVRGGAEPRTLVKLGSSRTGEMRAATIREELLNAPLSRDILADLEALAKEQTSPWGLAVRSSATCEDGALLSMAGLAETVLGVTGPEALATALRKVWASIASGRALTYLASHGIREVSMAVVFQEMVQAESAGVMFTRAADLGGARGERIVNASFGLGVPVVDGRTTPDLIRIDDRGRIVEAVIAQKNKKLVIAGGHPTCDDVREPDRAAVSTRQLSELAELAKRLEKVENGSWDVEFACDAQKTWLVQARPVTKRAFPSGGDHDTVWSNANVGEALPGVATRLTWSVAGAFSEAGFRRAFATLGCRVPRDVELIASVHGRFYLNISAFMRIAAQVPWLEPRTLLELAGCSGADDLLTELKGVSRKAFYARLPVTASRLITEQVRLDLEVTRYEETAKRAFDAHSALDLAILTDDGLAKRIREAQHLLEQTGTVMLTCASSALGTHLALQMLLARVAPIGAERLAQSLTAGIKDLESARPAIGIMRVSEIARNEPETREIILSGNAKGLDSLPDGPTRRALVAFLERYGDRGVREAELSIPRWREDPKPVLAMLRVALRGNGREVDVALERAKNLATGELERVLPRLSFLEQTALRHLVARSQRAARLRERMRAWVTRVLGLLRDVFLDADRRLLHLDERLERGSVFLLTVDEVVSALRSEERNLQPLVALRRAEHARDLARPDPPETFVGTPEAARVPPDAGEVLRGIAASAGVVEGRVRIVSTETMGELEPGEILVVHTTDVGWTPLFLSATGIVTELGGPLSHAAIVAREFGVPSVVNVVGATRILRTGDLIRVDGSAGTVERL